MFVRRLPEEYLQLESVESALTAKLRWQASSDFPGFALMPSASSTQKMEVKIRLPPHDNREESTISLLVNATMRVEELLKEVIDQHASRLGNSADSSKFELRLFDEDEEEPDYDFPPLDKGSEVGALNVLDIALCEIQITTNTPPSPPMSSPSEQVCELGEGTLTPEAVGGILQKVELIGKTDVLQDVQAMCSAKDALQAESLLEDLDAADCACDPSQWRLDERDEVAARTASGQTAYALVSGQRSFRRCRSSPVMQPSVVVGGFERFEAPSGLNRRHGSAMNLTAFDGHLEGTQSRQLTITLADGAAQCTIYAPSATSSTGSVHTSESETTSMEVLASSSTPGVCTSNKGDEDALAESIALTVRDDATLLEVLEQVSTQFRRAHLGDRAYDPVNFAFERMDDGIKQRLDLGMQVKQLPPDSASLTLVRKDAPIVFTPDAQKDHRRLEAFALTRSSRPMDALRRPLPSEFFFTEYTASIAAEYLVTVVARSSRTRTRPCECQLVVDRERLYHQPVRCLPGPDGASHKKDSFMSTLTKKLVKPWADGSRAEPSIFVERRVCDVQRISFDQTSHLGLCIVYSNGTEGGTAELIYQAQTPTECAEIIARVQFLQSLTMP